MYLGTLVAGMNLDGTNFYNGIKKSADMTKSFSATTNRYLAKAEQSWNKLGNTLSGMRKRFLNVNTVIGTLAGSSGLGYLVSRSLSAADSIAKTADMIGISTDALQEYRYVAQMSGVATDALDSGLAAFSKRLGDLRAGTGTLNTLLDTNNQKLKNQLIGAKDTGKALGIYFDALKQIENQSDRNAFSAAAFGRTAGISMTNMLDDIDSLRDHYARLGLGIDENLLRNAEKAQDAIEDVGAVIKTSFNTAVLALAPSLATVATNMADWVSSNSTFITQDVPSKIRAMALEIKTFTTSSEFKDMMQYWEIAAGALVGSRYGAKGALIGAGAGGYYSFYKDLKEAMGGDIVGLTQKAQEKLVFGGNKTPSTIDMTAFFGNVPAPVPTAPVTVNPPAGIGGSQVLPPESLLDKEAAAVKRFADGFVTDIRNATDEAWEEWKTYDLEYREWIADTEEFTDAEWSNFVSGQQEKTSELSGFMSDAFSGWATQYASTLTDMVWGSDLSFKSIAQSFGKMVTQMVIQWQMMKAMTWAFGAEGEGGAVTDFFSGLFHGGGVVGKGGSHRTVAASTFIGAPRLHGGGLAGDEVPTILKRGEIVLTPKQFDGIRGGGAPGVQVNVIDQTSEKKNVEQRQPKWDGDKWVLDIVLSALDTNRGNFGRGMKAALGRM